MVQKQITISVIAPVVVAGILTLSVLAVMSPSYTIIDPVTLPGRTRTSPYALIRTGQY
ncbi:MAG: hypothetical protein WBZ36_24250 [Candidatus Nitrosopolaris sp.]